MRTLGTQLHITSAHAMREEVAPVKMGETSAITKKPETRTGLWTSTYDEETGSSWVEWCHAAHFDAPYEKQWFILTPRHDARIYVIDSLADLKRILRDYQWRSPRYEQVRARVGIDAASLYEGLGLERLSQDYDALHLTERGQEQTHLSFPINLYGWDAESTLWFRWCFTSVEQITPKVRKSVQ